MRKQNYFCYNRNDEIIGKNALSGLVTQSLVSELKKKKNWTESWCEGKKCDSAYI